MSGESDVDPLEAALNEAQQLMDDIDVGAGDDSNIMTGFSIDSDEEDDSPPLAIRTPDKKKDEAESESHPLSDEFLTAPSPAAMMAHPLSSSPPSSAGVAASSPPQQQHPLQPGATNATPGVVSTPPTSGNGKRRDSLRVSPTADVINPISSTAAAAATASGGASLDVLKQQTSRFASNLASMGQKAFNQVATAAAATPTSVPTPSMFSQPQTGAQVTPAPMSGGMQTPVPVQPSPYLQPGAIGGQPQPQQQPQQLAPTELDSEQKAALIQTHVGELLPGERVIMFLSNLLHVSDSTGFSYSNQTQPNNLWCCAMTYYRLLLFSTHPTGSPLPSTKPPDWNASCWPSRPVHLLQMPLASMDRVEKSVFSSSTTNNVPTTLMGLTITGKDNGRQLRLTTPSYADTVRAHEALMNYAFPGRRNLGYLFAFESKKEAVMASIQVDATTGQKRVTLAPDRQRFQAVAEFQRQFGNIASSSHQQQPPPWLQGVKMHWMSAPEHLGLAERKSG